MSIMDNNCELFEELICLDLDNEITADEKEKLAEHIKTCKHCVEFKNEMLQLQSDFGSMDTVKTPVDFADKFLQTVTHENTNKTAKILTFKQKFLRFGSVAAVLAVCFGVSYPLLQNSGSDSAKPESATGGAMIMADEAEGEFEYFSESQVPQMIEEKVDDSVSNAVTNDMDTDASPRAYTIALPEPYEEILMTDVSMAISISESDDIYELDIPAKLIDSIAEVVDTDENRITHLVFLSEEGGNILVSENDNQAETTVDGYHLEIFDSTNWSDIEFVETDDDATNIVLVGTVETN